MEKENSCKTTHSDTVVDTTNFCCMNVSSVTYSEVPQAYRNFHFSGETFTCKSALRPTQVSQLGDTMK